MNSNRPAPGVSVTTTPAAYSVSGAGNPANITAVYTITTSPGTKGIFALAYPGDCPAWIPLAVGYTPEDALNLINTSYRIYVIAGGCVQTDEFPDGFVVGVTDMNVATLTMVDP